MDPKTKQLLGKRVVVEGHIHNVTYKRANFQPGDFAIIKFDCEKVISGELPSEILDSYYTQFPTVAFSGQVPSLSLRNKFQICGTLVDHPKYGLQYQIVFMSEIVHFEKKEEVERFFSYVFSETTTQSILSTLSDPIGVLERGDIDSLVKIPGVGAIKARKLIDKYNNLKMGGKLYIQLYEYGFTQLTMVKLIETYRSPEVAIQKIKENPYNLIYDVKGFGWTKADSIAANIGVTETDPRRIMAYIYYLFVKAGEDNGDTYMLIDELVPLVAQQAPTVETDTIRGYILQLLKEERLYCDRNTRRIGLVSYRNVEEQIATELHRIASAPVEKIHFVEDAIKECEANTGLIYSTEQRQAIYSCLLKNINLVSGMAGTGKSSIMYPVTRAMQLNNRPLHQCALSGKAALNLTEITGIDGSTIHRLLGYNPSNNQFSYNKENPIPTRMVILDETSMVDEGLFLSLLQAIPSGAKLILLGDTGQLEPIGLGCVFRDLINSNRINHLHFTKIFRQAQRSGIISEAAKVYHGSPIMTKSKNNPKEEIRGELQDFKTISIMDPQNGEFLLEIIKEYKRFMDDYNATPKDIIVVTGKRVAGETSTRAINEAIQRLVNGKSQPDEINIHKNDSGLEYNVTFRIGDRVLVTRNCYDTMDTEGKIEPVFNGNVGTVVDIIDGDLVIDFLQGRIIFPASKFIDLELGYALTCHKIQGSGIPYVITVCDFGSYTLLSKEWLYTAITRARKFNTLIAQPAAVVRACGRTSVIDKRTWLQDFIIDKFGEQF